MSDDITAEKQGFKEQLIMWTVWFKPDWHWMSSDSHDKWTSTSRRLSIGFPFTRHDYKLSVVHVSYGCVCFPHAYISCCWISLWACSHEPQLHVSDRSTMCTQLLKTCLLTLGFLTLLSFPYDFFKCDNTHYKLRISGDFLFLPKTTCELRSNGTKRKVNPGVMHQLVQFARLSSAPFWKSGLQLKQDPHKGGKTPDADEGQSKEISY